MKTKTTWSTWGMGAKKIYSHGETTSGKVILISICYWMKINTKPFRAHAWDGAIHPHMVHFQYLVNGKTFIGKRYWPWALATPSVGDEICVYYDPQMPKKWAVDPNNP